MPEFKQIIDTPVRSVAFQYLGNYDVVITVEIYIYLRKPGRVKAVCSGRIPALHHCIAPVRIVILHRVKNNRGLACFADGKNTGSRNRRL